MHWFYPDDLREAVRSIRRRPSAMILVAVTLALGIAGATITFSMADAILWHPLPFRDADQFVRVGITLPPGTRLPADVALDAWRGRQQMLEGIYPFSLDSAIVTLGHEPEAVTLAEVAPGLLDTLGVVPIHGRLFAADDFLPGSNVVVASEDFWMRARRAQPGVSSPTILVEGVPATIVGVMPERFTFPVGRVAFWRPLVTSRAVPRITGLGVLKRNLSIGDAAASARGVTPERSGGLLPRVTVTPFVVVQSTTANTIYVLIGAWWFEGLTVRTVPPASAIVPDLRALVRSHLPDSPIINVMTGRDRLNGVNARARFVSSIISVFAVVALVLALIGVYGAFWFFVRQRTREMAVRLAVGASPAMLIRYVLQSSMRLVAAGLAVGIPLAIGATMLLRSVAIGLPPVDPFVLAGAALGLTVAAMGATYLPARRAARIDPVDTLRHG